MTKRHPLAKPGRTRRGRCASATLLLVSLVLPPGAFQVALSAQEDWAGRRIMDEVFRRHEQFPYVFEEQTMVLMDDAGNRDVRKARRYSRVETDGTVKYLLVFDGPPEIRGVALLAVRKSTGEGESSIYLPAYGKQLRSSAGGGRGSHFLGTDFAIEDLTAEILSDFRYVRGKDLKIDGRAYFVVDAFPQDREIERVTGYSLRRHLVRQDNFYVVRTDYYDRSGRFAKRQTQHDLKRVSGDMWRANMVLMEDHKERHKTLLKIDRRVFSHDYVAPEIFTRAWILNHRHISGAEKRLFEEAAEPASEEAVGTSDG
jgi:hypothetical protein